MSGRKFPEEARQRHATSRVEQLMSGDCSIQSCMQSGREETSWELIRGSEVIVMERSVRRYFEDVIFGLMNIQDLFDIFLILKVNHNLVLRGLIRVARFSWRK